MYIHFTLFMYLPSPPSPKNLNAALIFGMEKDQNIIIRLSPNDKELVKKKASEAGFSVSAYARTMLLNGEIIKVDSEEKRILNGVANNLNQLTRLGNETQSIPPGIESTLRELINQIRNAYRKR